jgi:Polysaccharide deacetylase
LKSSLISILKYFFGVIDACTKGKLRNSKPNIIVFHEVSNYLSPHSTKMGTGISEVKAKYLLDRLLRKSTGNQLAINFMVTFDDGYRIPDTILHLLRDSGTQVIFFINQSTVLDGISWDAIDNYFKPAKLIRDLEDIMTKIAESKSHREFLTYQGDFMSIDELIALKNNFPRFLIGGHGAIHTDLKSIEKSLYMELDSKFELLSKLLAKDACFAWPYGSENNDLVTFLKKQGYRHFFLGSARSLRTQNAKGIVRTQIDSKCDTYLRVRGAMLLNRLLS